MGNVRGILDILRSDVVDDPEDLLIWLATDGVKVLEEYLVLQGENERLREACKEALGGIQALRVCFPHDSVMHCRAMLELIRQVRAALEGDTPAVPSQGSYQLDDKHSCGGHIIDLQDDEGHIVGLCCSQCDWVQEGDDD